MHGLALYQSMAAVYGRMQTAARANDWDALAGLESELGDLRARLQADAAWIQGPRTSAEREQVAALIRGMLENDREIRGQVDPWMESVRGLLSRGNRSRTLRDS